MAIDNTVELHLVFHSYQYCCIFLKNGTEDVKCHKWFKAIDWNLVYERKLKVSGLVSNNNIIKDNLNHFLKTKKERWLWRLFVALVCALSGFEFSFYMLIFEKFIGA